MIKINEAVIVEGKYDKIRLSNIVDTVIIQVNGFHIFDDRETLSLIKYYAETSGIIILTDSDTAGFKIRNFIKSYVNNSVKNTRVLHIYTPDIFGKEKRKQAPSKEGKLGVEGISDEILIKLFSEQGVLVSRDVEHKKMTKADLYFYGLSGTKNASEKRRKLLKSLSLPELLSSSAMLDVLNSKFSKNEFQEFMNGNFIGEF
jgi:ribonuclease M5